MMTEPAEHRMVKYDDPGDEVARLKDIVWHDRRPIRESGFIALGSNDRLYYRSTQPHGFDFVAVSYFSSPTDKGDPWAHDEFEVERYCHGVAYFDGVRHLWMPYVNYPNVDVLAKLMQSLAKLEDETCSAPYRKF